MAETFAFWGAAVAIAALALPLAFRLFARFPDGGAGLCFSLGLMLVANGYFLLRVAGALPSGRGGFLLAIALFALAMVVFAVRDRRFPATFRRCLPGVGRAAGVFTLLFFAYAGFRAYTPDISHTEQPMDFLFLNVMLVSPDYPPHDAWLAGERASYYYGGHLQAAVLTATANVPPSTGYNLALAAVFASAGAAVASLCAALARWLLGPRARGWIAAAAAGGVTLLLFSGSLLGPFELAAAHGVAPEGVFEAFGVDALVPCESGNGASCTGSTAPRTTTWYPEEFWFWWRASRLIPGTITEFPFFSFLLGDLHAHVMSIPGVLLALAISVALWRGRGLLSWREHRRRPVLFVVVALVFGGLAFVNSVDAVTFSAVLAAAVAARNLRTGSLRAATVATASYLLPPAILAGCVYFPWYLDLQLAASGLYSYTGTGTRPENLFLQFGILLLLVIPIIWVTFTQVNALTFARALALALVVPLIPFVLWMALAVVRDEFVVALDDRTAGGWATLSLYTITIWTVIGASFALARCRRPVAAVAGLVAIGLLILYGVELIVVRDILFSNLPRLNTVFKFSYQAWIVLSVAASVALVTALHRASFPLRSALVLPAVLLVAASLVYAVIALPNRTDAFDTMEGLDGLGYVARADPSEYALARWLAENADSGAIVVEATGRIWNLGEDGQPLLTGRRVEYSDAGRVSVRTGLQTPIGWARTHEFQWRGDGDQMRAEVARRQDLVDRVYTAPSEAEALASLRELGASYVVVGRVERSRYRDALIPPFETFLDVVFDEGGARIYRLPVFEMVATQ